MAEVPATQFKAKCLQLMDRVCERRESFVITKRGRPVAKLVPCDRSPGEPLFGRLRGMAEEVGDIVAPVLPEGSWAVLGETPLGTEPLDRGRDGSARGAARRGSRPPDLAIQDSPLVRTIW